MRNLLAFLILAIPFMGWSQEPKRCKVPVQVTLHEQSNEDHLGRNIAPGSFPEKGLKFEYVVRKLGQAVEIVDQGSVLLKDSGYFEVTIIENAYQEILVRSGATYKASYRSNAGCSFKRDIKALVKSTIVKLKDGVDEAEAIVIARDTLGSVGWKATGERYNKRDVWKCSMSPIYRGRAIVARKSFHVYVDKQNGDVMNVETITHANPALEEGVPVHMSKSRSKHSLKTRTVK